MTQAAYETTAWTLNGPRDSWTLSSTPSYRMSSLTAGTIHRSITPLTEFKFRNALIGFATTGAILVGSLFGAPTVLETTTASAIRQVPDRPTPDSMGTAAIPARALVATGRQSTPVEMADDLRVWLDLPSDAAVADLGGFSRRSLTNWRNGGSAYGASTRRLAMVHALVRQLRTSFGDEALVRLWLSADSGDGRSRQAILGTDDGMRALITQASALLFARPVPLDTETAMTESEQARIVAAARGSEPRSPIAPRRALRRSPAGGPHGHI